MSYKNTIFSLTLLGLAITSNGIYNGIVSEHGDHPYYVYLEIDQGNANKQECGGTLISNRHIVTAAHCVDNVTESIQLHFGIHETRDLSEEGRQLSIASAEDVLIHPKYSDRYYSNDLAIINLKNPVEFTQFVQPAKFSSYCEIDESTDVIAVGTGFESSDGQISRYLHWAPLHTITMDECKLHFFNLIERNEIFCANSDDRRTLCQGDSGNPALRDHDKAFMGIASFVSPGELKH